MPSIAIDNTLARQFEVSTPDSVWVTDITCIKTSEGFAYLAVVIGLCSRKVLSWSMQSRQTTYLVLQALLMAVWRRKPTTMVLIRSDQGAQFTSIDWASFLKQHNLEHSMSRRGNCHDKPRSTASSAAVAESFFNPLKRERIRRKSTRPGTKHAKAYSDTSKCSTTQNANTLITECCHPSYPNYSKN